MKLKTKKKEEKSYVCVPAIGVAEADPAVARRMTDMGGTHYAYQNQNRLHPDYGHIRFVMHGPGGYSPQPLSVHPHEKHYLLIGVVDLKTRQISAV